MADFDDENDFMRLKKKSSRISDWRNEATSIKELLDWNDLVRRINAWRVVCRLSVLELSKRAGLSRPTVTAKGSTASTGLLKSKTTPCFCAHFIKARFCENTHAYAKPRPMASVTDRDAPPATKETKAFLHLL